MFLRAAFTVILPLSISLVSSLVLQRYTDQRDIYWTFSLFFFLLMSVVLTSLYRKKHRNKDFAGFLLTCIVIKLILSLIYLVVVSIILKDEFRYSAFHFLIQFFLFTTTEVYFVVRLLKH